jgi:benzoyl-CoA reductase/2-hydroxyglutaryl-CoA dehydratase subunit BcrC/BadD/HgdB
MMNNISACSEKRITELLRLQKEGKKIVGYVCGGFMPEELVWASGAIPVGINRGGNHNAVIKSMEYIPRVIDTFSRTQIGYWALEERLYRMIDLFIVPCTDINIQGIASCWEMWTDTDLFKLGIPHNNKSEHAYQYYYDGLCLLKEKLEKITGNPITDDHLRREIELSNRMRRLLRLISESRKTDQPPLSGKDFLKLNHTSFYTDRDVMITKLESVYQELNGKQGSKGARIFLIGSSIADGDYKVYDLLESAGADVVIEDFSEGMRLYRGQVRSEGDLIEALADYYFKERTPLPAFFRPATEERCNFFLKLAKDYKIDGIIWYSMLYREAYDVEGMFFGQRAEREGLPFIKIVTDYDTAEHGMLRTRIEAFTESIRGKWNK